MAAHCNYDVKWKNTTFYRLCNASVQAGIPSNGDIYTDRGDMTHFLNNVFEISTFFQMNKNVELKNNKK